MTPKEITTWTVESVREWARDLFATRDEALRLARDETRRETDQESRRVDEALEREVAIRDQQFADIRKEMDRRLEEERVFRERVTQAVLTREDYRREHTVLESKLEAEAHSLDAKLTAATESLEKRVSRNEAMLANIQGKAVVFAILGSVFLATVTAFVTHLLSG